MAWNPINDAEVQVNKPVVGPGGFGEKVKDNLNYLYGQIGTLAGVDVPNGSFEIDSDADGVPDQWTVNLYPPSGASQQGLETVSPAHGKQAAYLTHPGGPGNGGGYYESDYIACSQLDALTLEFIHWATAAGMRNQVIVRFFDKAKVDLAQDNTVYNSTSNPTSPTLQRATFTPPANARFIKIRLVGGYTDTDVAGTAYFDGVRLFRPSPFAAAVSVYCTAMLGNVQIGAQSDIIVRRAGTYGTMYVDAYDNYSNYSIYSDYVDGGG